MSAPGAPPETSSFQTEDEPQRPATPFESNNIPLPRPRPPEAPGPVVEPRATAPSGPGSFLTSDERFAPGTPPNMAGQLTVPEQLPVAEQPMPTRKVSPLFSPAPMAETQIPIRRRDQVVPKSMFSPTPESEAKPVLSGGIPRANYMRGQHGKPGENLVDVTFANGGKLALHRDAAPAIKGFVDELLNAGAPIRGIGGYGNRKIAGTNTLSQHAYGNAIDIDQSARNVVAPAFRKWAQANPDVIRNAATKWGMISGGDWKNPDFGHFEWAGKSPENEKKFVKQVVTQQIAGSVAPLPAGGTNTFVKPVANAGGASSPPAAIAPPVVPMPVARPNFAAAAAPVVAPVAKEPDIDPRTGFYLPPNWTEGAENQFQREIRKTRWFKEFVKKYGEEPDLNDVNYNYRQAFFDGAHRQLTRDPGDGMLHWPSQYKGEDHPNRFVDGRDTREELASLSQTKPWVAPKFVPAPFKGSESTFPLTSPIPSQSFVQEEPELPPAIAPVTKQRDPLDELNYLAVGQDKPNPLLDVTQLNTLPPPPDPPQLRAEGPVSTAQDEENIPQPVPVSSALYQYQEPPPKPLPPNFDIMTTDMPLSPDAKTDAQKAWEFADTATRGVRQMGKGFLNIGQLPWVLGAGVTALSTIPGKIAYPNETGPSFGDKATNWMLDQATGVAQASNRLMGLGDDGTPKNIVEKLAEIGGGSIMPAGKMTGPLSVGVFSVRTLFEHDSPLNIFHFFSEAGAATPKKPKKEVSTRGDLVFEPAVEGHLKPGTVDIGKLNQTMSATHYYTRDGKVVLIPNISLWGKNISIPPELAVRQYFRTGINFGTFDSEEAADKYMYLMNSKVVQPVNTLAGPTELKASDIAKLSVPLIATIGIAFAPALIGRITQGRMWKPTVGRPVENAHPDTLAWSTQYERARAMGDDINATASLVGRRMGLPQPEIAALEEVWSTHARGSASNLATSAVENGMVQTSSLRFRVPTSYEKLNNAVDDTFTQYMYWRNAAIDIEKREAAAIAKNPNAPPGPMDYQGHTKTVIQNEIRRIEQQDPTVRQKANVVRQNNKELNRFEEEGEYGTITLKERTRRDRIEAHLIHYGNNDPKTTNPAIAAGNNMHTRIRLRAENEAKGITVDTMNRHNPGAFVLVTKEELRQNDAWRANLVTIRRRGVLERYTTDPVMAAAFRTDPYYAKEMAGRIINGTRKAFEAGTTGIAAPWFAPTSMLRSHNIIKATAPAMGWKAPHIGQTIAAIPRQLTPQFKNFLAQSVDQTFGNWAGRNLGPYAPAWVKGLGKRWEAQYKLSQDVLLQSAGARYGTILQHQEAANRILDSAIMRSTGPLRLFLKGWQKTFESIHNAPGYATALLNKRNVTRDQLALGVRRLTGDPQAGGEFAPGGRQVGFARYNHGPFHAAMDGFFHHATTAYGATAETARKFVPWYNISLQGAKRIARAWREDPVRFAMYMFTAHQLPAAAAYMWNRSLGKDATGQSYVDYMMNLRSPYNTMLNHYIAIPGRPAAEGIELPWKFHEVVLWSRLMEIAMDHMFKSNTHTMGEDFRNAALNAVNVFASVPWHPVIVGATGSMGIQASQGPFEGQAYRRRSNSFDVNTGLHPNIELTMRGFGGGISDILANGLNSMIQAEGWEKPGAFVQGIGKKAIERTPILRNVAGMTPKQAGNTRVVDDMFKYQGAFKMLDEYYRNYGVMGGGIKLTNKPASGSGGARVEELMGPPGPAQSPGLGQPVPQNPVYQMTMAMLHDMMTRDVTDRGKEGQEPGMGLRSMWQRYSRATKILSTLTKINPGNMKKWHERIEADDEVPDAKEYLMHNRVDYNNPTAVMNFYEGTRQDAARHIIATMKEVEAIISAKIGKPFKIADVDPHKAPSKLPEWLPRQDVMEHLQGIFFSGTPDIPPGGYTTVPGGQ